MARLNAPLFSLGARGSIGKALIYSVWKGVAYAKQYVVPSNPNTGDQQAQRTKFNSAVEEWHQTYWGDADKPAWNVYAASLSKAMSGFNSFCSAVISVLVAGKTWIKTCSFLTEEDGADIDIQYTSGLTSGGTHTIYWGFSPSSLVYSLSGSNTAGTVTASLEDAEVGVTYYFKVLQVDTGKEGRSGVYSHKFVGP